MTKEETKLISQSEGAKILDINRSSLNRWLKRKNIQPIKTEKSKKLYSTSILKQYKEEKIKKEKKQSKNNTQTPTTKALIEQIKQQQKIIEKQQKQIEDQQTKISEYADKFYKLATQSQSLQLIQQKQDEKKTLPPRKHWWQRLFNNQD